MANACALPVGIEPTTCLARLAALSIELRENKGDGDYVTSPLPCCVTYQAVARFWLYTFSSANAESLSIMSRMRNAPRE